MGNKFEVEIHTNAFATGGRTKLFHEECSLSTKQLQKLVAEIKKIIEKLKYETVKAEGEIEDSIKVV